MTTEPIFSFGGSTRGHLWSGCYVLGYFLFLLRAAGLPLLMTLKNSRLSAWRSVGKCWDYVWKMVNLLWGCFSWMVSGGSFEAWDNERESAHISAYQLILELWMGFSLHVRMNHWFSCLNSTHDEFCDGSWSSKFPSSRTTNMWQLEQIVCQQKPQTGRERRMGHVGC